MTFALALNKCQSPKYIWLSQGRDGRGGWHFVGYIWHFLDALLYYCHHSIFKSFSYTHVSSKEIVVKNIVDCFIYIYISKSTYIFQSLCRLSKIWTTLSLYRNIFLLNFCQILYQNFADFHQIFKHVAARRWSGQYLNFSWAESELPELDLPDSLVAFNFLTKFYILNCLHQHTLTPNKS